MAQDYNEYLAEQVLNERQYVSYRSLSRALKVHCNLAKQMLYEFHRKQNAKKPNSVHATYLICGTKRRETTSHVNGSMSNGEDVVMQSSPPLLPSSSMPRQDATEEETIAVRSVVLVREEQLEQAQAVFENMSSIHVYSLEASSLNDLQVLTECNRKIASSLASEDPLESWQRYGTIKNSNTRRRTRKTGLPPPAPATAAPKAAVVIKQPAAASAAAQVKSEPKSDTSRPGSAAAKPVSKPPALKASTSGIFKAFAKSKPVKAEESQDSGISTPQAEQEDHSMGGFSDDDDEEDQNELMDEPEKEVEGTSKKQREAELQAMMEQDDDDSPMEDAAPEPEEPEVAIDQMDVKTEEEPKETVTVENGRRRGRRRIMKKVRVKGDDGYLVTREEAAWESFSEDEPATKKVKSESATPVSNANKGVKKGGKPGQGSIMTFFAKK